MQLTTLYKQIEPYLKWFYNGIRHPHLIFHNLPHTQEVVNRAEVLAKLYDLPQNDQLTIMTAAWFKDTGYLLIRTKDHAIMSYEIMRKFMEERCLKETEIHRIGGCIMATKEAAKPTNFLEQIICDADTYHFGTSEFQQLNERLFKEKLCRDPGANQQEFNKETLLKLINHQFYTSHCKQFLNFGKITNINSIKEQLI